MIVQYVAQGRSQRGSPAVWPRERPSHTNTSPSKE